MYDHRLSKIITGIFIIAILLTSCGGPQTVSTPPPSEQKTGTLSDITVAAVFEDLINDGGFTQQCFESLGYVERTLGVKTTYQERVATADVPLVLRDFANEGIDIIISFSGGTVGAVQEVAPQFPNTTFVILAAKETKFSDNVWVIGHDYMADYFITGALAGMMTKTNKLGFVGGEEFASYAASAKAFEEGAKYVNPEIKDVFVTFVGAFDDALGAKQSASALFDSGVDIISSGIGSSGEIGLFEAARDAGGYIITLAKDRVGDAPDVVLTGIVLAYPQYVAEIVEKVAAGEKGGYINNSIPWGLNYLAPFYGKVPADVEARLQTVEADLKAGKIKYTTEADIK